MATYTVTIGGNQVQWTPQQVQDKLQQLSQLKNRKVEWIQGDLSLYCASVWILIAWCIVRTILPCMASLLRLYLLGIDLTQSQAILNALSPQVVEKADIDLFNRAVSAFNAAAPHHQVNLKLESVQTLVDRYEKCWSVENACFEDIPFDQQEMVDRLTVFSTRFPQICVNYKDYFGYIQKIDVPAGSRIYVRADLHGDLRSLLSNLQALKEKGLLDDHFRCVPGVYLIFDGDYADRGTHSMQVLEVLAALKMENLKTVVLIRGNHEALNINDHFGENDPPYKSFLGSRWEPDQGTKNRRALLRGFYQRMPLTLYVGQEGLQRQYIQVTHGMFEPTVDPALLLDDPNSFATMLVPKQRVLSDRIKAIQFEENCDYPPLIKACQDRIQRRILKQAYAAQRITHLVEIDIRIGADKSITAYNWGDMSPDSSGGVKTTAGSFGDRQWGMDVGDIQCYLRLSSLIHPVKMVFRGHEHAFRSYSLPSRKGKEKIVVMTLPVGMDSAGYKDAFDFHGQLDRAYIFEVQPKVRDWTKMPLLRKSGIRDNTFGNSDPMYYESDFKLQG